MKNKDIFNLTNIKIHIYEHYLQIYFYYDHETWLINTIIFKDDSIAAYGNWLEAEFNPVKNHKDVLMELVELHPQTKMKILNKDYYDFSDGLWGIYLLLERKEYQILQDDLEIDSNYLYNLYDETLSPQELTFKVFNYWLEQPSMAMHAEVTV